MCVLSAFHTTLWIIWQTNANVSLALCSIQSCQNFIHTPFYLWHQNCSKLLAIRELLQPTSFYGFHSTHSLQLVKAVVSLSFWNDSLAVFISTLNEWQFQIVHQRHFKLIRLANTIRYSNEIDTLEPHLIFQQTAISPIAHYVMFLTNALRVRQVINNWRDCANVSIVLVFKLKYFLR